MYDVTRGGSVRSVLAISVAVWGTATSAAAASGAMGVAGLGTATFTAAGMLAAVAVSARRAGHHWGPADVVTLSRGMLACCVAGLVVDGAESTAGVAMLVALSSLALVLDAVDGRVARATRSSAYGARLDGEIDAFLILVLSVHVAAQHGGWVLFLGAARYLFWLAGRAQPWLRGRLPFRYWRKVVAAAQGIVLTAVSTQILPVGLATALLVLALALLLESFGRDVLWTWQHRSRAVSASRPQPESGGLVASR